MSNEKQFDSLHEEYFEWWLEEGKQHDFVLDYKRSPSYELIEPQELHFEKSDKPFKLFREATFQPDYTIIWNKENVNSGKQLIFQSLNGNIAPSKHSVFLGHEDKNGNFYSVVDIKPDIMQRSRSSTFHTFPINQKLMYLVNGIYVNKIVLYPASNSKKKLDNYLFVKTWTPKLFIDDRKYKTTRPGKFTKGDSMIKFFVRTIDQFKD